MTDRLLQLEWRSDVDDVEIESLCFGGAILGQVVRMESGPWEALVSVPYGAEPECSSYDSVYSGPNRNVAKDAVESEVLASMRAALTERGQP